MYAGIQREIIHIPGQPHVDSGCVVRRLQQIGGIGLGSQLAVVGVSGIIRLLHPLALPRGDFGVGSAIGGNLHRCLRRLGPVRVIALPGNKMGLDGHVQAAELFAAGFQLVNQTGGHAASIGAEIPFAESVLDAHMFSGFQPFENFHQTQSAGIPIGVAGEIVFDGNHCFR